MGRIDDVLNVSGHRLGTMEIESALVANSAGRRGRGRRPARRPDRRGDLRVRRAEAGAARGRRRREDRQGAARLGRQGDRPDRQAEGHPLRRQPAEDALRQDHAPAAALDRQGRGRSRRTCRRSRIRRFWSSSSRRSKAHRSEAAEAWRAPMRRVDRHGWRGEGDRVLTTEAAPGPVGRRLRRGRPTGIRRFRPTYAPAGGIVSANDGRLASFSASLTRLGYWVRQSMAGWRKSR